MSLTHGQDLAGANRIVKAYSERRQALWNGTAVSPITAGSSAQSASIWRAIQDWLEGSCTSFIDDVNGPLTPDGTGFLYFTKATWQAAAGLNVSAGDGESFRRKVNLGDAFSYGHIQTGDFRGGAWIFEDLVKGLEALKWSFTNSGWQLSLTGNSTTKTGTSGSAYWIVRPCDEAFDLEQASWDAASWVDEPVYYGGNYTIEYSIVNNPAYQAPSPCYYAYSHRHAMKIRAYSIPTFCPWSADVYAKPTAYGVFEDLDGMGIEVNKLGILHSFPETSGSEQTSDYIGKYDADPLDLTESISCLNNGVGGFYMGSYGMILKYKFTSI